MKTQKQLEEEREKLSKRIDRMSELIKEKGWANIAEDDRHYYWDLCAQLRMLMWILYGVGHEEE